MPASSPQVDFSSSNDELRRCFAAALDRGERPSLDEWNAALGPRRAELLPSLVVLKLDRRLRAGENVTAGEYLARFPELSSDPQVARDLVRAEYLAARARNPAVDESTFRRRYPELTSDSDWLNAGSLTTCYSGAQSDRETFDSATAGAPETSADPMDFLRDLLAPSEHPGELGRFGAFRIVRVLGAGGMGVVLEGRDEALGRKVAIKLMQPKVADSPTAKERFLREARAMAAVDHPRIVAVHQVGELGGVPFLVMPLMAGASLGKRLKSGPRLSIAETIRVAREIAEGLAAAHARGVVHRDVKPDNIWLEESEDGFHVRLLDFGLARHDGASPLTQSGAIFGTPSYMAPEQADGAEIDARADLFSVGCVLYELATGRRAFTGSSLMAILSALANHVPEPAHRVNPEAPQSLSRLIDRLLAKKPADRPASAAEVVAALREIEQAREPTVSFKPGAPAHAASTARRPRVSCQVTILAAALLFAPLAYFTWRVGDRELPRTSSGVGSSTSSPKILSFSIKHFAPQGKDEDVLLGLLGETSFAPRLNDKAQVSARLSSPGYSYLLAFRPDGEVELCHPASDDRAPPLADVASYPAGDEAKTAYGLREGTGLWLFAVIASDRPLPPYKEWIQNHDPEWKPRSAPPATVWRYDGTSLKTLQADSSTVRGKDEIIVTGAADAVLKMGKKLESFGVSVGVVGFAVTPRS